jgi:hypothetical protein
LLAFAQLRDVLAAKDSSIVPQKNQHCRLTSPQRAEKNLAPVAVREGDIGKSAAEGAVHASSILSSGYRAVKRSASALRLVL